MTEKIAAWAFAVLLAAMPVVPASVARADTVDDEFVQYLESHGIHLGSPSQVVNMGRTMCKDLEAGYSQKDEVDQLTGKGKLSQAQAEKFIGAATAAYCPDKHPASKPGGN